MDEVRIFSDAPQRERFAAIEKELSAAPSSVESAALFASLARELHQVDRRHYCIELANCFFWVARYHYLMGEAFSGIESAEKEVVIGQESNDATTVARTANLLAVLHTDTGNYPAALDALAASLKHAQNTKNGVLEAAIFTNLGIAHIHAGKFDDAVACYERAIEINSAKNTGSEPKSDYVRAVAFASIAHASLFLNDLDRGLQAAEQTIKILAKPQDDTERFVRATVEFYYIRMLLQTRNITLARKRAAIAKEVVGAASDVSSLFVSMAIGLVEVYSKRTRDIGLSRLQGVVQTSRRGTATALRDALSTMVVAYQMANQPNEALLYMHEISELNGDNRVRDLVALNDKHVEKVLRQHNLLARANAVNEEQMRELRQQRLSMDVLKECMLLLEETSVAAELHDDETGEHCYRVGALARELALRAGVDEQTCTLIDLSARLHDIGKIKVPNSVLLKPGQFTPEERAIMEKHCEFGAQMISEMSMNQAFAAREIALGHHERWDGKGYPHGQRGTMIPLAARITALADVFDALTHRRCYKQAWSTESALAEIGRLRGAHFDPGLTDVFLKLVPELLATHGNLDSYLAAAAHNSKFIKNREILARRLKGDDGTFDARR